MDFKNWMLFLSIVGIVGFSAYYISQNPYIEEKIDSITLPTASPRIAGRTIERPNDWRQYAGLTFKFYHPEEWYPENSSPFGGAVVEDIVLNIPEAINNSIYYSVTAYDIVKPEDIVFEEEVDINDRKWTRWIREGEDYVSYDYYTKDKLEIEDAQSFGVRVTVAEKDEELEENLLILIDSIEFEFETTTDSAVTTEETD